MVSTILVGHLVNARKYIYIYLYIFFIYMYLYLYLYLHLCILYGYMNFLFSKNLLSTV